MSIPHDEIPRAVGWAVAAGAAVGWPVLAFDFVGLAAVMVATGTLMTATVAGYIALRTAQIHRIVNSTATALRIEADSKLLAMQGERDELRRRLDASEAEGRFVHQSDYLTNQPVGNEEAE